MLHCPRKSMRTTILFSGMLLVTSLTPALAADPTGDWQVADGVAHIRVAQCNGNMWGAGADQWEGQVYNAKDGQYYSSTITPTDPDHMEIRGCVLGFLCGGETWSRVAGPIPSSPANSMAKGTPKNMAAMPKTAATTAAPKTTGSINPPGKKIGQKLTSAQAAV